MDRFTSNQDQNDQRPILHIAYRKIHFTSTSAQFWGYFSVCRNTFRSLNFGGRKFIFFGVVTPYASEWWCNSRIKMVKGNKNVKIVFRAL